MFKNLLMEHIRRLPTLAESLVPVIFLTLLITINVFIFKDDSLSGSNQLVLLLSAAVASVISIRTGITWNELQKGIVRSIGSALPAILILLLIGSLAGTWLLGGIVPAMIYYGLEILNPSIFLFAACVVSSIVSLATGSSWSTVATIGVALLGIGKALGIPDGLIAGAIISGAYFGDKMSPLSDTTNLAPAMAGTDLFTHIRYMMLTTIPTLTITLLLYLIIGFSRSSSSDLNDVSQIQQAIEQTFHINLWLFIPPGLVILMIVRKIPAVPALLAGTLAGVLFALIFQPQIIRQVAGSENLTIIETYRVIMKTMYTKISITTSHEGLNNLLQTNGMAGMLNTVWLILCAMIFGGVMETAGFLQRITRSIIALVKTQGSLIASTALTCIFFNITASDQYLSIVVPGRMFADTFRKRGLAPQNLSRTLEDSGTVTSVLVPWNTCGATQSTVLGIPTLTYLPFAFFNLISPLMTMLFAFLNIRIARIRNESETSSDQ